MVKKALAVRLVAKHGKEAAVESFLNSGLELVKQEPLTVTWYAVKFDDRTFGIFDAFDADEGRDAHLNGKVAEALMANASELLASPPEIFKVDVIAVKSSGSTTSATNARRD
ncbi:MAG: antibiotic biosynthesis monooxygenase [Acidobacteria bacterium]|nr:antibiotic biosynthesis monooxygenase [Acidobacteriota bacterium]MCA1607999.1 antibiotic biosynthesis monooxygenase [Acidobacteriota bacterium]